MGNMSSPTINRWGSNTFWYHFWYSDSFFSKKIQQDSIFLKLLNTYLFYGLYIKHNLFSNLYWFKKKTTTVDYYQYFRNLTVKNALVQTVSNYRLRKTHKDIFLMKTWILRYDNWLIINFSWFQPSKPKRTNKRFNAKNIHDVFLINPKRNFSQIVRLKTAFYKNLFFKLHNHNYYVF